MWAEWVSRSGWEVGGEAMVPRPPGPEPSLSRDALSDLKKTQRSSSESKTSTFFNREICIYALLMHAKEAEMFCFSQIYVWSSFLYHKYIYYLTTEIKHTHCLSLTSGTAQWCGHSSVHDEKCAIQPRALQGHLYLLDARVQSSLPGLLPGEDGMALAAELCGWWTHSSCGGCKAWGVWMEESREKGGCRKNKRTTEDSPSLNLEILQQYTFMSCWQYFVNGVIDISSGLEATIYNRKPVIKLCLIMRCQSWNYY